MTDSATRHDSAPIAEGFRYSPAPVARLRRELANLQTESLDAHANWRSHAARFRELARTQNPYEFLTWDTTRFTMFVDNTGWLEVERSFVESLPEFENRWKPALRESPVGAPAFSEALPFTSENLLHLAFSAAQFETLTDADFRNCGVVFEFGGGYGGMCRLLLRSGFKGKYILFDLPHVAAIQRFYLTATGFHVYEDAAEFQRSDSGIFVCSELETLAPLLAGVHQTDRAVLIATWSLSEAPTALRDAVLQLTAAFQGFLLAYQSSFDGYRNFDYFHRFQRTRPHIRWQTYELGHLRTTSMENYYLFGARR